MRMTGIRIGLIILTASALMQAQTLYVAPNGNDLWSGTLPAPNGGSTDGPLASLAGAQAALRKIISTAPAQPLTVMLRNGTYYLPGRLNFASADSGAANMPVKWQNFPGETPVVSGGIPAGNAWTNPSGNLWQTQLPAGTQPFEYLFYNGQRRLRSRVAGASGVGYYMKAGACTSTVTGLTAGLALCNAGTFLRVAAEIPPAGADAACPSVINSADATKSKCLDRFGYAAADPVAQWINLNPIGSPCGGTANSYPVGDIGLTLFDSWTVDAMRVSCVDTSRHVIFLTGAAKGSASSYNFFGPTLGHRYIIENALDAFSAAQAAGQTGIWFLDRSASPWILNYIANANENPNADNVVIAQLAPASATGGSLLSASGLSYVTFQGITFEADNFIPPAGGFNNDENGESTLPAAIDCESCQQVTFDSVVVRHTSASGLQIASAAGNSGLPASNDVIQNSAFYDIGSSGIHIGHHPAGSDAPANVVQSVTVQNNIIQGYSRVFADGEGIAQGNGHDITYTHNDITDGYHSGISICLLGCPSAGFTANGVNISSTYNHIWNIMQGITSDGGTLYYNIGGPGGSGSGGRIFNNLLHDATDASILDAAVKGSGYGGHGIYLDNQSAGVDVENNVVYQVADSTAFITSGPAAGQPANTFHNNIFALGRQSMFGQQSPWPQGCGLAPSPQVNVANNIFYFDKSDTTGFYVTRGCADSCGMAYNQFQNFQGNLYWRTDGKFSTYGKAFHVLTTAPTGASASACSQPTAPATAWTFLTFTQWQSGTPLVNGSPLNMNEDAVGTVSVNPGFGSTGLPADYQLAGPPVAGFSVAATNDTILHAGRNNPVIFPPNVAATYPTYVYLPVGQTITFAPLNDVPPGAGPFLIAATANSGLPVSFVSTTASICTVSGPTVTLLAAGSCSITASQAGNTIYAAAASVNQSFNVGTGSQTIAFGPLSNVTFGVSPFAINATASSGLVVSFAPNTAGVCSVSGNIVTVAAAGSCSITASQPGNASIGPATPVTQSFGVNQASQTITFSPLSDVTFGVSPFAIGATASSGLVVGFASNTAGVCNVSGNVVTVVAGGSCSIAAIQGGNANIGPATPVTQSFNVNQASQTITFGPLSNVIFGVSPFAISATASSGLGVSFTSNATGICTVAGNVVTVVAAGPCSLMASQAGSANYTAAAPVVQGFNVTAASQTITFGTLNDVAFGVSPFAISATASSGLVVNFTSNATGVCTVAGNVVTVVAAGPCLITASQAGSPNYAAAAPVVQGFNVTAASQTISFGPLNDVSFSTAPIALTATASSGLAVTFASTTASVCTVSGNSVTLVTAGSCSISASQAGNANYTAATSVVQSFNVIAAPQTITFSALGNVTFGVSAFTISATASSGLAVTFTSTTAGVCAMAGNVVTVLAGGSCSITASQAGNANYAAATSVVQSFSVTAASQTITFGPLNNVTFGVSPFAISASASSGLAVTFTSGATSVCTVAGSVVAVVGAGACPITASQAGNSNYAAATPVTQTLTVNKASQTINFGTLKDVSFSTTPITLAATASSGLGVTFASTTTGICVVSGNALTLVTAGICSISASQAGNSNYAAATNVVQNFTINPASQTIAFAQPGTVTLPASPFTLAATASSGLPVSFVSTTTSICTVSGTSLTPLAAGSCSITASQAGNTNYAAATPVTRSFTISAHGKGGGDGGGHNH